jgi:uncharacterized protein with HEPN domain
MTTKPSRVNDYLGHILQAIARIQRYTAGMDGVAFASNELIQDAVIRNLEIIGEASRNIARDDPAFAAAHPQLPLGAAYEMRNVLAHGYFRVDVAVVWATLQSDLPRLQQAVHDAAGRPASQPPDR